MPQGYKVVDNGRLVVERWVGYISHAELIEHEKQQLNDTSITRGAKALADTTQARFPETSLDRVHELSDLHADPRNKTSISKYALLVADETWPKAKLFEKQVAKYGLTAISFNSLHTASAWLGLDAKTITDHIKSIII